MREENFDVYIPDSDRDSDSGLEKVQDDLVVWVEQGRARKGTDEQGHLQALDSLPVQESRHTEARLWRAQLVDPIRPPTYKQEKSWWSSDPKTEWNKFMSKALCRFPLPCTSICSSQFFYTLESGLLNSRPKARTLGSCHCTITNFCADSVSQCSNPCLSRKLSWYYPGDALLYILYAKCRRRYLLMIITFWRHLQKSHSWYLGTQSTKTKCDMEIRNNGLVLVGNCTMPAWVLEN